MIAWSPLAGGWLTGNWRKGQAPPESTRAQRLPQRYDLSLAANQRKLDAADALTQLADESSMTLIHMALAFVIDHPAVTSAIIGPRTMEQLESQLGAVDVQLDAAILDRIDEIVPPGTNFTAPTVGGRRRRSRTRRCADADDQALLPRSRGLLPPRARDADAGRWRLPRRIEQRNHAEA